MATTLRGLEGGETVSAQPVRPEMGEACMGRAGEAVLVHTAAELNPEHSLTIDPFLFDILFKNLLRNALRYGDSSSPIFIKTELNKLSISNAGEALKVDASKIFERFVSSNQSASSLGLGLSLVKRICDLSGLEISYSFDSNTHIFSITSNPV